MSLHFSVDVDVLKIGYGLRESSTILVAFFDPQSLTFAQAFNLFFDEIGHAVSFTLADPKDMAAAVSTDFGGSYRTRMINALKEGSKTRSELSEECNIPVASIRNLLSQEKRNPQPAFKEWKDKQISLVAHNMEEPF